MSATSLSDSLALVAADPSLAGHPVVAGLLTAVECELVSLRARVAAQDEELADLRRQLGRHSGNRGSRRRSQGRKPIVGYSSYT